MSATARQPRGSCLHTMRRHSLAPIYAFSVASLLLQQLLLASRLAVLFYSANPTALQSPPLLSGFLCWAEWTVV